MLARRSVLFALAAVPVAAHATAALAVDALPDARFVGFCQTVNDFEIASGRLALAKSTNELIRGYASRMVAEHTESAQFLVKARSEAGVSYAPDPSSPPNTVAIIQRLNSLTGPEFDTAYANAQLAIQTQAHDQYGAYSQNGDNGALRRYAQRMVPKSVEYLEYARRIAASR